MRHDVFDVDLAPLKLLGEVFEIAPVHGGAVLVCGFNDVLINHDRLCFLPVGNTN